MNPNTRYRVWQGLVLDTITGAGAAGRKAQGTKVHRVTAEIVVGLTEDAPTKPGTYAARYRQAADRRHRFGGRLPTVFSAGARCYSNGQHAARIVPDYTPADINCQRCLS